MIELVTGPSNVALDHQVIDTNMAFSKNLRLGIDLHKPESKASDRFVAQLCLTEDLTILHESPSALQTSDKYIPKSGHWREYPAFLAQLWQLVEVEKNGE